MAPPSGPGATHPGDRSIAVVIRPPIEAGPESPPSVPQAYQSARFRPSIEACAPKGGPFVSDAYQSARLLTAMVDLNSGFGPLVPPTDQSARFRPPAGRRAPRMWSPGIAAHQTARLRPLVEPPGSIRGPLVPQAYQTVRFRPPIEPRRPNRGALVPRAYQSPYSQLRARRISASSTAFVAAPLRRLSETTQKARPRPSGSDASRRTRPTRMTSRPAASVASG